MTLCHFLLFATSAWALKRTPVEKKIATGCFLFIFGHSILGILFDYLHHFRERNAIDLSICFAETAPHPLINAQLYMSIGRGEIGYLHLTTAVFPIGLKLLHGYVENEIINLFQTLNIISSIYLAIQKDNGWCCLLAINQLIFSRSYHHFDEDKLDWIAAGLCLFSVNAVKAIESLK